MVITIKENGNLYLLCRYLGSYTGLRKRERKLANAIYNLQPSEIKIEKVVENEGVIYVSAGNRV